MSAPSLERTKLEQRVIRAAMACLSKEGWIYGSDGHICRPANVVILENALADLKMARARRKRR